MFYPFTHPIMLARQSALVLKSGCVVRNENGDMRSHLQLSKTKVRLRILAVYIAAKDVLPTLHC